MISSCFQSRKVLVEQIEWIMLKKLEKNLQMLTHINTLSIDVQVVEQLTLDNFKLNRVNFSYLPPVGRSVK